MHACNSVVVTLQVDSGVNVLCQSLLVGTVRSSRPHSIDANLWWTLDAGRRRPASHTCPASEAGHFTGQMHVKGPGHVPVIGYPTSGTGTRQKRRPYLPGNVP